MPTDIIVSLATPASALDGTELVPCAQAGASRALTPAQIAAYLSLITTILTRLTVDNLRLDGNTLSVLDANGSLTITPNGTGNTLISSGLLQLGGTSSSFVAVKRSGTDLEAKLANDSNYTGISAAGIFCTDQGNPSGLSRVAIRGDTGVVIGSTGVLAYTSGANVGGATAGDAGTKRAAAATLLDTDGGAGLGGRLTGRPVEASTAGVGSPNLLLAVESRKLLTNEGAGAEAYNTLPTSAPVGYEQLFYCQAAAGIRIVAPTGTTIRLSPSQVCAAGGFVRSLVAGSGCVLTRINSTEFVAVNAPNGTWTVDV